MVKLGEIGIPTHFVRRLNMREQLVRQVEIIPIKVVIRNVVAGSLANRRLFAEVDRKLGAFPDGLCVDAEGFIWSNQVGIGRVVRYDPRGRIERQIQLPVPRAVGCTFGGDDLDTLFTTSARETMTPQQLQNAPLSGSVFAVNPGVRGQAVKSFDG